jgi:hypothetical protein
VREEVPPHTTPVSLSHPYTPVPYVVVYGSGKGSEVYKFISAAVDLFD